MEQNKKMELLLLNMPRAIVADSAFSHAWRKGGKCVDFHYFRNRFCI